MHFPHTHTRTESTRNMCEELQNNASRDAITRRPTMTPMIHRAWITFPNASALHLLLSRSRGCPDRTCFVHEPRGARRRVPPCVCMCVLCARTRARTHTQLITYNLSDGGLACFHSVHGAPMHPSYECITSSLVRPSARDPPKTKNMGFTSF